MAARERDTGGGEGRKGGGEVRNEIGRKKNGGKYRKD